MRITARQMELYADRLRRSKNEAERRSILMGMNPHHEYPITLDTDLLLEHMHILGSTGSGKTSLGLIPLVTNLIRNDETCIVLDLKGDDALFHTTRLESERAGRQFKWFTNRPNYSTYVFNPFTQKHLESLTIADVTGFFIASLNLHHGSDYGRAYFSIMARTLLQETIKRSLGKERQRSAFASIERERKPIRSFEDLHQSLEEVAYGDDEYRNARHLVHVIQNLADFPQLNISPQNAESSKAADSGIHMPDVLAEKQVAYFYLSPVFDATSVAEVARLVIYSTMNAAVHHFNETGKRPRVFIVCDEAQHVIGQNINNVLAQARSFGVGCVLSHQTLSQLAPPGAVDLREIVLNCTAVKQFWAARDPRTRDYISEISGEVNYYKANWQQLKKRVLKREIGRQFAAGDPLEGITVSIAEEEGPRLTAQDIEQISRHPNMSIMAIHRNHGYSCYDGAFPVLTPWSLSKDEYDRRSSELPWPDDSDETLVTSPEWTFTPFEQVQDREPEQELREKAADLFDEFDSELELAEKGGE